MSGAGEPTITDIIAVLSAVETRLTGSFDVLRGEVVALRGEVATLRGEVLGNTSAIDAIRTEMEANTASILSDVARQTAAVMQRMDALEQRLTQALADIGVNWNHAARVERKVENLRDETRLGDQTVHEIMRMVRAMEERISRLERGRP